MSDKFFHWQTPRSFGHDTADDPKPPMQTMSFPTSPTDDCKSAATKWTCISTATTHIAQHPVTLNLPASGESHDNRPGILEIRQLTGVQDAWTASPVDGPSPPDKSPATSAPQAGGRVTRSRFSWKKGFLTNHKLPTRQRTPASTPHNHTPPTQPQSNNTPLALLRHGKKGVDSNNGWTTTTQERTQDSAMVLPLSCTNISLPGELPKLCFSQHYDIRMRLYGTHGKVYSKWEALTKFLLQLQAHDSTIQLLPWKVTEHNGNNPAIEISSIPNAFFNLHKYVPHLASLTTSWTTRADLGHM